MVKRGRRGIDLAGGLAAVVGLVFAAALAGAAEDVVIDGIAAQVGSGVVLFSDVDRAAEPVAKRMREGGAPFSQIAMMRAEALERLIDQTIVSNVVERTELSATEDDVSNAVALIAQDAGLTFEQLAQSVTSHGMTIDEYRAQIKKEIERSKIINAMVRSRVRVEPEEVHELFLERYGDQPEAGGEEVRIRHILVSSGVSAMRAPDSACQELETVRSRIISGETNFDQAARSVSDFRAEVGGDAGWMSTSDLAAWMAPSVSALDPGQMTPVLRMSFGCNLIMVSDRRSYKPTTFEEVQPQLEAELHSQRSGEEMTLWMDKLRSETYIERKGVFAETTRLEDSGGLGRRP